MIIYEPPHAATEIPLIDLTDFLVRDAQLLLKALTMYVQFVSKILPKTSLPRSLLPHPILPPPPPPWTPAPL